MEVPLLLLVVGLLSPSWMFAELGVFSVGDFRSLGFIPKISASNPLLDCVDVVGVVGERVVMLLGPPSRPLSPPKLCSRLRDPMVIYASSEAMLGLARSLMGYRAQSRISVSRECSIRSYTTIPGVRF